jgi:hypothetical protein
MDRNPVKLAFAFLLALAALSVLPFPAERGAPTEERADLSASIEPATDALVPRDDDSLPPHRDPYEAAIGLNACRKDTGEFAGEIGGVHYGDQRLRYFSLSLRERVERVPDGRGGTYEVEVYAAGKRALALAELFDVTDGKCPDGRP